MTRFVSPNVSRRRGCWLVRSGGISGDNCWSATESTVIYIKTWSRDLALSGRLVLEMWNDDEEELCILVAGWLTDWLIWTKVLAFCRRLDRSRRNYEFSQIKSVTLLLAEARDTIERLRKWGKKVHRCELWTDLPKAEIKFTYKLIDVVLTEEEDPKEYHLCNSYCSRRRERQVILHWLQLSLRYWFKEQKPFMLNSRGSGSHPSNMNRSIFNSLHS